MTTEHDASGTLLHEVSRTLVKSPPELWAECSDGASLARHIGEFGEIRITRLEPESAVIWEGERARGTVRIEASGWGTRVTLTAHTSDGSDFATDQAIDPPVEEDPQERVGEVTPPEQPVGEVTDSPSPESDSVKEESDAKVEETFAEPDPAVAANSVHARGLRRWMARTRSWFTSPPAAASVSAAPPGLPSAVGAVASEPVATEPVATEPTSAEPTTPTEPTAPGESAAPSEPVRPAAESCPSFDPVAILVAALDSLGQAHHRPFSRA